jgi:membrane protease YdiL (CAAX protease family)
MKRPAFWILFAGVSLLAAFVSYRYFPKAFSIVSLEITMDRERALADARALMARDRLGPTSYRQAASFALDSDAQTFVELEGGGKEAFTRMLRDGLYSAYTWRVRHFKEGEPNETLVRFTPSGQPYGFHERLKEDAPGAALDAASARRIAEERASGGWRVDLTSLALVEQGQERRPGGRIDHTFTYERAAPTLNEGRYRLRLVTSGDRLTEVTHFVKVPEAFTRRYENMRSANEAIGIGAVVSMTLFYIVGGIGVGLFFMLRHRWVVWRPAIVWGAIVGLLQALALLNSWPLLWMSYDTAVPRTTFVAQQLALAAALFVGMSAFLALSFMAAESLTRRAFGSHPQLWRVWGRPGSSTAILGRTAAGYLLVPIFIAYEVGLYMFADRVLGWWTPSESLLHPDVLATYLPWLTAIANSLQAGFWEEALFRAIPLAGAALIGDRLGHRRLAIAIAFVLQAVIFGAGHAPYPTLPSYARPVELMIPSFMFGLLYLRFGLLPGIVLHYAFDAVLFALPIFVSDAPGILVQQLTVVVMILVPMFIVFWRRAQAGQWATIDARDLNAAWTPAPPTEVVVEPAMRGQYVFGGNAKVAWLAAGVGGLVVCAIAAFSADRSQTLPIDRHHATRIAKEALERQGVKLDAKWRLLGTPESGEGAPHQFVSETAGEERRRQLLGTYLPWPYWRVRVATFEGDVAERAEEWTVSVRRTGEVGRIRHVLPEQRPGASLDEDAARRLAHTALVERLGLDAARRDVREVSAKPNKRAARTDWEFVFADTTVPALPQGELRVQVEIAGDEIANSGRIVHIPEEWTRQQAGARTRAFIFGILGSVLFGGIALAAAITAVVSWSRGRYAPWLFVAGSGLMLVVSVASGANEWPLLLSQLSTAQPLKLQIVGLIGLGLVGLTIAAVLVGLALGALPHRIAAAPLPYADAWKLAAAAGLFGAAISAIAAWLRTPVWARAPDVAQLGTVIPILGVAIDPLPGLLMRMAVVITLFAGVDRLTLGWSRRRVPGAIVLLFFGFLAAGAPQGSNAAGWLAAGALMGLALLATYVTLLRADLTMMPLALGTAAAAGELMSGAAPAFPGALAGSMLAAALTAVVGWWWFRTLHRARAAISTGESTAVPTPG